MSPAVEIPILSNGANGIKQQHHIPNQGLRIIIVGGGIGGLTAAIALRNQGHHVAVYEQSRFANEIGAAIHMTPNAMGALKYIGIDPRDAGAVKLELSRFLSAQNVPLRVTPNNDSHRWQDAWVLAHRAHLHNQLKAKAAAMEGPGEPVQLITSSRVETADAQTATITLSDGSQRTADVLIGADGVHSNTRSALSLHTKVLPPFKGKHNAFRFTMPRKVGLEDPETEKLVNINGTMDLWYSEDRKIVLYSTAYNEILNFVCIHPAELSESSDDYQTAASVEKLLDVYADFHPSVVKLLSKADPAELKVYRLYDMPTLSTYVSHRLALIGDAAHPFTPHLAQGGAMAIEDGVSLGIMLDKDVTPQEVPERLQLYNQARHHRSSTIQEYSRLVGGDGIDSKSDRQVHQLKVHEYIEYGFSHNEVHASSQILREHKWKKLGPGLRWRQPTVFGPLPGPRQALDGGTYRSTLGQTLLTKANFKIKTSATLLRTLFPNSHYSFVLSDSVAYASFSIESFHNLAWLGGHGYDLLAFYIYGVQYKDCQGRRRKGTYCPIMFENLADPIITGRDELGFGKVFSDLAIRRTNSTFEATLTWKGAQWAHFKLNGLKPETINQSTSDGDADVSEGILLHKYIPSTGGEGKPDADYDVLVLDEPGASTLQSKLASEPKNVDFKIESLGEQKLPTLHPFVDRLAEIPVFEVIEATVNEYLGVPDLSVVERLN